MVGRPEGSVGEVNPTYTQAVLDEVCDERVRQDGLWGIVTRNPLEWFSIAGEEYGEVAKHVTKGFVPPESDFDQDGYRTELIQLAAVCVSAVEDLDYGAAGLGGEVTDQPTRRTAVIQRRFLRPSTAQLWASICRSLINDPRATVEVFGTWYGSKVTIWLEQETS